MDYLCVLVVVFGYGLALDFSPIGDQIGLNEVRGRVVAYADFDGDKSADLLLNSSKANGQRWEILLWKGHRFQRNPLTIGNLSRVVGATVGDFDGDGVLDLLLLRGSDDSACRTAEVCWCETRDSSVQCSKPTAVDDKFSAQTLTIDANGDHISDLLSLNCENGSLMVWTSLGASRNFSGHHNDSGAGPLKHHTCSLVDINSDCLADIVVDGVQSDGERVLEVWLKKASTWEFSWQGRKKLPADISSFSSHIAVADLDGDTVADVVLLSCTNSSCEHARAHVLLQEKSEGTDVFHCKASKSWSLSFTHTVLDIPVPLSPRAVSGRPVLVDMDLDGLPDIVTVGSHTSSDLPLILVAGNSFQSLSPVWLSSDTATADISLVMSVDLWEDGIPDILFARGGRLVAHHQTPSNNHAFLKLLVVSGHCFSNCSSGRMPYGSALPGAVVAFSTTDSNGNRKMSSATLQPGSTLQPPFVVFGLGQAPNFVESVMVGAGCHRQWSSLIPNSQVVVIPSPPTDPSRWVLQLYLTPSSLVYSTAGVLASLFVATAVVVIALHMRERLQDSREKKQAKHRFHFNAM